MLRAVSFAMCLFVVPAASAEGLLRWKLDKGDQFVVTSALETIQTFDSGAGKTEMPMTFSFTTEWTVTDASADAYKIDQRINRVQLAIKYPGGELSFDSNEKAEGAAEPLGKLLRPLVGTTVTKTLTTRGEVKEVKIPEELIEKFAQNPLTKKMMSEESVTSMFSQANVPLPEKRVEKGQSWEAEGGVTTGLGNVGGKQTYTYAGREEVDGKRVERIDVASKIDPAKVDNPLGGKLAISEATGKGKVLFDAQAGHLLSSTTEHTMTSKVELFGKAIVQELKTKATTTIAPGAATDIAAEEKSTEE